MNVWQSFRRPWCKHSHMIVTPRTLEMPSHKVCETCGFREPVDVAPPQAIRTWDSTRDEDRYEREKKRRIAAEQKRQVAISQLSVPSARAKARRSEHDNVVEIAHRKAR
jgi:hypothetical protein